MAGQRPGVEQAESVQQPKPELQRQDGYVRGVIEELLRLAVVEHKGVVDHHEIHVGVAPVDQRVAEQKKRCRKAGDDRGQSPSPTEESQPVEGILRGVGRAARPLRPGRETGSWRRSFSPAARPKRRRPKGQGLQNRLSQRNDEVRSFAGFAGGDALIGNDDRAAGRQRLGNARHCICRDSEAIQCLSGAVRHRHCLHLDGARDFCAAARRARPRRAARHTWTAREARPPTNAGHWRQPCRPAP